MIGWTSAVRTPCGQQLGRRDQSMLNCVSLGRPLGGRPGGSPRTSMGWDMTHRGRHRSYQGRPRTPRGRPNCPADVHGTVDALWTQQRAIELRLYARLVSSAWWRRRLDHAVLFKSFISVTHCPSQRNWWIVQIYGIPMPEQVGIFFRGFARLMKVSHCPSGSSLVIAMTWPGDAPLVREF